MSLSMERVQQASPANLEQAMKAMNGLEAYLAKSGLENSLIELIKTRASQLNGCAYCIDMHTKDAPMARVSSDFISSMPGRRARFIASENAPHCSGPKR